ncbi:MAG TPA: molybdate ABC transporter substrate-binding protein [Pirellulales bacterium]|nr:molybdate ABC transporter substrate-binding protein [Pirellulales bacterium]
MSRLLLSRWIALIAASVAIGCGKKQEVPTTVTVFAAASATEAIEDIAGWFEQTNAANVKTNFAASSTLARQILEGAPADIFISADEQWADELEDAELVDRRDDLLGNRLVVVVGGPLPEKISDVESLTDESIKHVALGDPESVPAGRYAKQALEKLGIWEAIKPKVVTGADVRQALLLVERGEADAGIVYATDAQVSVKVHVAASIDPKLHDPIRYPALLLKTKQPHPLAGRFYEKLFSREAAQAFVKRGFAVLDTRPESMGH